MGTTYSVKVVPFDGMPELPELSQAIEDELHLVNKQMSTYDPESEISRFNSSSTSDWFEVSDDTARVVTQALELSQQTKGAFDVTVGPLVELWGFGKEGRVQEEPPPEVLAEALERVSYLLLEADLTPPRLRKQNPATEIDLSGIAKGHGVDRVAEVLRSAGATSFFVEIGGEIRTAGKKRDGSPWRVGIEKPIEYERGGTQRIIELGDKAIATSGDYRNVYELKGKRVSHTIDPRTGYPVQDQVASATVVADSCAEADAIATGMMACGYEHGIRLANDQNWTVMLIARGKEGFLVATSEDFEKQYPDITQQLENAN